MSAKSQIESVLKVHGIENACMVLDLLTVVDAARRGDFDPCPCESAKITLHKPNCPNRPIDRPIKCQERGCTECH